MSQNEDIIRSFTSYLEEKGKGGGTALGLGMEIHAFADFLKEQGKGLLDWKEADIDAYGKRLTESGKSAKTVHRRLHNLLIFTRFLISRKLLPQEAETYITNSEAYNKSAPRPLTPDEVKRLILACPDVKTRTLFTFLYETGIRPEETSKLKQEDVNWDDLYVLVRGKEGEKSRPVFFNRRLKDLFRKYLRTRKDSLPYLFAEGKTPLTKTRMQILFTELAGKIGLEGHVGVDSLWRSLAAHMLEQGFDETSVGQLLGLENPDQLKPLIPTGAGNKGRTGQFVSALDM